MSKINIPALLSIALCFIPLTVWLATPGWGEEHKEIGSVPNKPPYHYVIAYNEVVDLPGEPPEQMRSLDILMEEKYFNEASLRDLCLRLSRRFQKPNKLTAWIYTRLEQLETPEENDLPTVTEMPEDPKRIASKRAFYWRYKGQEFFSYYMEPPYGGRKRVILGSDPY